MWQRLCNQCRKELSIDGMRFIKMKQVSILFYKEGRFHCESKNNEGEIAVCENCARGLTVRDLFIMLEGLSKETKIKEGPDSSEA